MPVVPKRSPESFWHGEEVAWDHLLIFGKRRFYAAGQIIYMQGNESHYLYYIRRGRVRISITRFDGSEKVLAIQECNTLMGESAAFDGCPHFATATAAEDTEIYAFHRDAITRIVGERPEIGFQLIRSVTRKLRVLAAQVASLAFLNSVTRVAFVLDQLADHAQDGQRVCVRITHDELASITGLCRVTVTKALNQLEVQGYLRKSKSQIDILDRAGLRQQVADVRGVAHAGFRRHHGG